MRYNCHMETKTVDKDVDWASFTVGQFCQHMIEEYGNQITRADVKAFESQNGVQLVGFDLKKVGPMTGQARSARYTVKLGHHNASERIRVRVLADVRPKKSRPQPIMAVATPIPQVPQQEPDKVVSLARVKAMPAFIPKQDPLYSPFGSADMIEKIISSERFTTVMVTGPTGCGKTFTIEQACAKFKRPLVKFSVTTEVNESTLFGDFRLVDGSMAWYDGPVITAMRQGAVLLLDELPKADPDRIMAIQEILVGNPYMIKKTGELISPAPGFQVIATGNSRGNGDQSGGMYLTDKFLDEAFKERFQITLDAGYPTMHQEMKLLIRYGCDKDFAKNLATWARELRQTYEDGSAPAFITTRRLIHIINNFEIVGDRGMALDLALGRFEPDVAKALRNSYSMVDETTKIKTDDGSEDQTGELEGFVNAPKTTSVVW